MWRFLIALLFACPALADPKFIDVAPALEIDHRYIGGWEHFVGGGVAAFDCNGDDLPELFAAGGEGPPALLINRSTKDELIFVERIRHALALQGTTGAYPIDIDSDGWMDLVVLRAGGNVILKGEPDCYFTRFAFSDALAGDAWTTAFSATWEAGEAWPTLAFGNYVDRSDPNGPFEACDDNQLYRPDGEGYEEALPLTPGYCALSMLFSDWSRAGRADLRISNDRHYYVRGGEEQLWSMDGEPRLYNRADGWRKTPIWGMGIASRDITGDGVPEIYLTSMADQKLQFLEGEGPGYADAPFELGAAAQRPYTGGDGRPSTGWHAEFGDVDNDGDDDLFVSKGNVEEMPSSAMLDPNNLLLWTGEKFEEGGEASGLASMAKSRGAVVTDLNGDGKLDIAVVNRGAPMGIYQNTMHGAGGWLALKIAQSAPNRNAVGAWIEVETAAGRQSREITVGGGHVSGWAGRHHFGLGEATAARVRVIWPGGTNSDWIEVEAGAHHMERSGERGLKVAR
ncbi:MAG: CRTAC1 family protein [Pseudomonadota bacterium]